MLIIKKIRILLVALSVVAGFVVPADIIACTSAVVLGKATKSGRPMLWKNRDTGTEHNFVAKVPAKDGDHGYVALYNGGDSLLLEAWAGINDAGFGIMNTASYNLAPDTAKYKDREAEVMSLALKKCRSVDDFEKLLREIRKPMGVQANFGVIDALGNGAYFETDDYSFTRFNASDDPSGVLIRTNYSETGNETDGYGYIRYENAKYLLDNDINNACLTPESFIEGASRSFYHSLIGEDFTVSNVKWVVDQDFIPRRSTSASVVLEGVLPDESPELSMMWVTIGYPPCSYVLPAFLDNVPEELKPTAEGWRSKLCNEAIARKRKAFPIKRGSGPNYIDMEYLRPINEKMHQKSLLNYQLGRKIRDAKAQVKNR